MSALFKLSVMGLLAILSMGQASASYSFAQVHALNNDKEVSIIVFSVKEQNRIKAKFKDEDLIRQYSLIFFSTVQEILNREKKSCEFNLVASFKEDLSKAGLETDDRGLVDIFKLLRVSHAIDDILYKILSDSLIDMQKMSVLKLDKKASKSSANKELVEANDLNDLFSAFSDSPDEKNSCSYQAYWYIKANIFNVNGKKLDNENNSKDIKALIAEAYKQKIISLDSYHKLNYLHEAGLEDRDIWLEDYFKIIFHAKNKLTSAKQGYFVKKMEDENKFSTERIKRFSKITRRRLLYRKYDETQIILLAQVLQKASRRMGVDPDTKTKAPVIVQEFLVKNQQGKQETYVEKIELDIQSQYNLARRRMRKDIVDLQMMDLFLKQTITHEDVVMAALETGYISLDDIEYVVKYDDLWNPEISRMEKITGFIFNVAGYTTFFLPAPWNITASIAMGVIEGLIESKNTNGADNDNSSTFIE